MQNFERFLRGDAAYSFSSKDDFLFFINKIFSIENNKPKQSISDWINAANSNWEKRIAFTSNHKKDGSCGFYATDSGAEHLTSEYDINEFFIFNAINENTQLFPTSDKIKSCICNGDNIVFTGEQFEKIIPLDSFVFINGIFTHNISYFNFTT